MNVKDFKIWFDGFWSGVSIEDMDLDKWEQLVNRISELEESIDITNTVIYNKETENNSIKDYFINHQQKG